MKGTPLPARVPKPRERREKLPPKARKTRKKKAPPKAPKGKPAKAPKRPAKAPKGKPAKAPKGKPAKAPKRPAKAPKRPAKARKGKPAKQPAKQRIQGGSKKRSAAAKKGWNKRRKMQRVIDTIVDQVIDDVGEDHQPLGWLQRRAQLRMFDNKIWRRVVVEYDPEIVRKRRLEILKELDMDLLTTGELYDSLKWSADHYDIPIGTMYRMYLGYSGDLDEALD